MKRKILCGIIPVFLMLSCAKIHETASPSNKAAIGSKLASTRQQQIPPDMSGMSSNAFQLVSKMHVGWNLGNTLEAIGGETYWGNPLTTEAMIRAVKSAGINAVRLPCSWNQYLEDQTTYKIKESWLARVKEVVDYCVNNDMYAILNIHWDEGWLEKNCTPEMQESVNKKQKALWEQIAVYFRDYDEHLLFASSNEPDVKNSQEMAVLHSYYQTFVDAVRNSGGRNTYRNLIVQGPATNIDLSDELMTLPHDPTGAGRMIMEVHYYAPYNFCLMPKDEDWGKMFYFWGEEFKNYAVGEYEGRWANWGGEDYVREQFSKMKRRFTDQGIPGIVGEFCSVRRTFSDPTIQKAHDESRNRFHACVAQEAKNAGFTPFLWDVGGVLDRRNNMAVIDPYIFYGLMWGANMGKYPF
ncbi:MULTISPECIES: glycoside hydrolase family 5 protein [Olivibacter]|jgi:aryl-phospho-beta-D-glucosidase BglC (GH1 family)|uniref:Glycoside hydrolase family 5 protein n=1 Tax=Olivibacter oleidegradans TaxID=760123 RepID=A0ABV6HSE2_9SPHI|nr:MULTISPECIES: glycoside hydrolase family 5 protein [Olivibacter]MDM8174501.1 glycoside hydrolase family 5 protein [Olivibacter sp. 47]QEL01247.1 glycoside hydrolase family 5 protein [Olivibacter sp. LS-1]